MDWALAFDTARPHCAAALLHGGEIVAARAEPMATGQAERLLPMLDEVMAGAGIGWRDLGVIGVGTGPGNFTGTRIAVAAARGLALGLGVPAVGVSYFEAMAGLAYGPGWLLVPGPLGLMYARGTGDEPRTLGADEAEALPGPRIWLSDLPAERVVAGMARLAAEAAGRPGLPRPAPLYLRAPDAAPAREAPPVLVPG